MSASHPMVLLVLYLSVHTCPVVLGHVSVKASICLQIHSNLTNIWYWQNVLFHLQTHFKRSHHCLIQIKWKLKWEGLLLSKHYFFSLGLHLCWLSEVTKHILKVGVHQIWTDIYNLLKNILEDHWKLISFLLL